MTLEIGQQAPDFTLPTDSNGTFTLSDHKGKAVVVYFYPKDDTPGCTKESCGFNDNLGALQKHGAQVIGISKCSVKKHDKFKEKYGLQFPLGSDENDQVCEAYGTWVEKSMYGRKYMGIDRATFLIDADGKIAQIWRKVKVPGHVEAVISAVEELKSSQTA